METDRECDMEVLLWQASEGAKDHHTQMLDDFLAYVLVYSSDCFKFQVSGMAW